MKKILSIALAVVMIFAMVTVSIVSSSAETTTAIVFDADTFADTIKTGETGTSGDIDKYVVSNSNNNNISIIDSTLSGGSKVLEIKRTGVWDDMGVNYANSNLGALAQNSIGFKFWAASNTSTGAAVNSLTAGFRFTDANGNHTYVSADGWYGANQLGKLTDEGAYYEIKWDTTKLDPVAGFSAGHNRLNPASNENSDTTRVLDTSKLGTMTAIHIVFEDAGQEGRTYYVDDFQFIYDGEAPEVTTVPSVEPEEPSEEETSSTTTTTTTTTVPSVPSSNLALGKNTVSSALENSSHLASNAVDGKNTEDANNRWASDYVDNAWWVVDLGDVYDVNSIKIYWEGAYSKEYKIQVATDEAAWADVSSKNLTNNQKDETYWTTIYTGGATKKGLQELNFAEENAARYVCFQGVTRGTSYGNSFYEFEVYGAEFKNETTDLISTVDGASIRLNEVNGMRFYATVNANLDLETVAEMGIIIAPKDVVEGTFTMEDDHIKVTYDHKTHELWKNNQIVGSIVNVKDKNLNRDFIARAYIVIDGLTYYAKTTTVRSLARVASVYKADENGGFAELDEEKKALVDKWAKKDQLGEITYVDFKTSAFKTQNQSGYMLEDPAFLILPPSYSEYGEATRLVMYCHGYSETLDNLRNNRVWFDYFAHNGYAILVTDAAGYANMGCPDATTANIKAYNYVVDNYNIKKDGVFVKGSSMGGMAAQNLVCSGEVPVIAQINESSVTSLYRQAYCDSWTGDGVHLIHWNFNFDFTGFEDENGVKYTPQTFPYSKSMDSISDDERQLFINNFEKKIVPNNHIWKYISCYDYENKQFKPGYEDFLTATDETRIAEMYDSISVDYPVPLLTVHATGDAAVSYVYSKRLTDAINRSENGNATLITYGGNTHCRIGGTVSVTCEDDTVLNVYDSLPKMFDFVKEQETLFENK